MSIWKKQKWVLLLVFCWLSNVHSVEAVDDFQTQYSHLYSQWARVNFSLSKHEQNSAFASLVSEAKNLVVKHPQRAESFILLGLIESDFSEVKTGTSALSMSKEAKKSLERSLHMNDSVLGGLAYTLLGELYHKVPAWPLGFGNNKKAHLFLQKALERMPYGLNPNYCYAALLFDEQNYKKAKEYLVRALSSKDAGMSQTENEARLAQARDLLLMVNKKLNELDK